MDDTHIQDDTHVHARHVTQPSYSLHDSQMMEMESEHEVISVASRPVSSVRSNKMSKGVLKKTGALERVLLPAGCYLYYARDENGVPHFQSESSPRLARSGRKTLGVVNPVCSEHQVVEKEYAVIREVVEVYLEEQLSGSKENRYRAGGFIQDHRQLLAKLAENSANIKDLSPEKSLVPFEQESPVNAASNSIEEEYQKSPSASHTLPPLKASRRSLLPISKSLQGDVTPRGPFVIKGSRFHGERGERNGENSEILVDARSSQDAMATSLKKTPLLVQRVPLTDRTEEKKEQELQPGFDVIRTTQQKYPSPAAASPRSFSDLRQDHFAGQSTPKECSGHRSVPVGKIVRRENGQRGTLLPEGNLPLQLVSERSPIENRWRERKTRETAGMTPSRTTRPDEEIPSCVTPPSGTFREPKHTGEPGSQRAWKPLESRKGPEQRRSTRRSPPPPMPTIQGRSYVTRMPSRIILNVILPREDAGQDTRLCSRVQSLRPSYSRTDTPRPSNPLPSPASTPPHTPPPPTVETHLTECPLCEAEARADHLQQTQNKEVGCEEATEARKAGALSADLQSEPSQHSVPTQFNASANVDRRNTENIDTASKLNAEDEAKLHGVGTRIKGQADADESQNAATSVLSGTSQAGRAERKTHSAGTRFQSTSSVPAASTAQTSQPSRSGTEFWVEERRAKARLSSAQNSVPVQHLDLGPRMVTAESTFYGKDSQTPPSEQAVTSCKRATHCDLFGPELCADCEVAQHRQQFSARQEVLYPQIDVFPRQLVAPQKFKDSKKPRPNQSKSAKFADGPVDNDSNPKDGRQVHSSRSRDDLYGNSMTKDGLINNNFMSKNGHLDSNRKSRDGPHSRNSMTKSGLLDINRKSKGGLYSNNSPTKDDQYSGDKHKNSLLHNSSMSREDSQGQRHIGVISQPRWPYISVGQLKEVVTDFDLCKRIVEKGHRAKLPATFLTQPKRGVDSLGH